MARLAASGGNRPTLAHSLECQWNAFVPVTATPTTLPRRTGPVPADIALLTRNRLWAWLVLQLTPEISSWDGLDKFWLAKIDTPIPTGKKVRDSRRRRRVLERLFRHGQNPGSVRGLTGKCLLDVVRADATMAEAVALFDSSLWALTAPDELAEIDVERIQAQLIERLGLIRLTPGEANVAEITGFVHEAAQNQLDNVWTHAERLADLGSVDAMALLGCCFRLAMARLSLIEANVYLECLRSCITQFTHRWVATDPVVGALKVLIETRLVRRRSVPVDPGWLGFHRRSRRKPVLSDGSNAVRQYHWSEVPIQLTLQSFLDFPVVVPDDAIAGFLDNFAEHHAQAHATAMTQYLQMTPEQRANVSLSDEELDAMRRQFADTQCGPVDPRGRATSF